MRDVPSLLTMLGDPEPTDRLTMTPWEYVRLRRASARLTIAQAAAPFWVRPEHREDCERNMAMLEQEGVRCKYVYPNEQPRLFFSVNVYRQLADLPAHQHPRLCAACGWDDHSVQYDINGHDVTWAQSNPAICTRCEQQQAWEGNRHAA